jgi:hypothetical protein
MWKILIFIFATNPTSTLETSLVKAYRSLSYFMDIANDTYKQNVFQT